MTVPDPNDKLPGAVQSSWRSFIERYEPLRPDLYRYCRQLTRSPWDAEDLTQDALARAFVTLAQLGESPPNPRAWLFRVASNLWIDRVRKRRREQPLGADAEEGPTSTRPDAQSAREAAGTLLGQLSPQERAAVVLKDVFELSLEETAEVLATTVGAIKAALSRARGKLVEPQPEPTHAPVPSALTAFADAFNAGDLERLAALLLDSASVEVVSATTLYGREAAKRVLDGMLFGVQRMVHATPETWPGADYTRDVLERAPRVEVRAHRDGWVLLHWYAHRDGEAVRALTRLSLDGDRVALLSNYFYNPDLVREVCEELGVPSRSNGYRWCHADR
ncbi:MAG TPA: sigma-70 family RNA polymerase sigma factor [Polyangiales bacterium]